MSTATVVRVTPDSPAGDAGIAPGDEILTVNGEAIRDVIQYQVQVDEPIVDLQMRSGGLERTITIEKRAGAPLGIELNSAVFDRVRTCDNHCPFCFIYQLPKGMRKSLYLKDDDYRLSFLYGNFTTLTRFTEADLERVLTEKLSPLYVSIHATDPDVRTALLRNKRGATSLRWLRLLLEHGVEVHGQIVVCPGINDGEVLEQTLLGVLEQYPQLATIGIVPLGVSSYTKEPEMRAHTEQEADTVIEIVEKWQKIFQQALGRKLAYTADEYFLMANQQFPQPDYYEDFLQHENGIGMARTFHEEVRRAIDGEVLAGTGPRSGFFGWVDGAPAEGYRAPRMNIPVTVISGEVPVEQKPINPGAPIAIITGEYGARVLQPLLDEFTRIAGVPVRLLPVTNQFFGGNIAVTGLLTASDVANALAEAPLDDRYFLPDVVLSNGKFLDGGTLEDLPRTVEVVPTNGSALVEALRATASRHPSEGWDPHESDLTG